MESVGLKEEDVGHTGQDKMEERYSKPFRRAQMMGKARDEYEEYDKSYIPWRLQLRRFCLFSVIDGGPLKRIILMMSPDV